MYNEEAFANPPTTYLAKVQTRITNGGRCGRRFLVAWWLGRRRRLSRNFLGQILCHACRLLLGCPERLPPRWREIGRHIAICDVAFWPTKPLLVMVGIKHHTHLHLLVKPIFICRLFKFWSMKCGFVVVDALDVNQCRASRNVPHFPLVTTWRIYTLLWAFGYFKNKMMKK